MLKINCDYCKRVFGRFPCEIGNKNYCSKECQYKAQSRDRSGKNNPNYGNHKFVGENHPMYGGKHKPETIAKIRLSRIGKYAGKNSPRWKDGATPKNKLERNSLKNKQFIQETLRRDNYTCQICSKHGCKLHVDHIMPWSLYPKLRQNSENVRILCKPCHGKYGSDPKHKPTKWAISPIR